MILYIQSELNIDTEYYYSKEDFVDFQDDMKPLIMNFDYDNSCITIYPQKIVLGEFDMIPIMNLITTQCKDIYMIPMFRDDDIYLNLYQKGYA